MLKYDMQIGNFESDDIWKYRTQFYFLFGYGKKDSEKHHRKNLLRWFNQKCNGEYVKLYVNRNHQIQLSDDKILHKLVRTKVLKLEGNFISMNIKNNG